jgi:nucleotide-binding universal stress UspA family protein
MKTILVPVDFSKCSNNAAKYAMQIAAQAKCKVILLHSYHVPIAMAEVPQITDLSTEIKRDSVGLVKKLTESLQKDNPAVKIETTVVAGFAHDAIIAEAKAKKVDLIIMGTRGKHGVLDEIFGSVTSGVIAHSKLPVLAVPEGSRFKGISKIALSVDLYPNAHKDALAPLVDFAKTFNAEIMLYHIAETDMLNIWGFDKEKARITKSLGAVKHSFFEEDTNDVTGGIDKFVRKHKAEVLSVISRKHNFIERLFWRSITRRMALHSKMPFLALPE